jgi:hypothetical protein
LARARAYSPAVVAFGFCVQAMRARRINIH